MQLFEYDSYGCMSTMRVAVYYIKNPSAQNKLIHMKAHIDGERAHSRRLRMTIEYVFMRMSVWRCVGVWDDFLVPVFCVLRPSGAKLLQASINLFYEPY